MVPRGWGGFIMMESIHYEVADGTARSARSGAQPCAAMDGEWKSGERGIEVPSAVRRPWHNHSTSFGCPALD